MNIETGEIISTKKLDDLAWQDQKKYKILPETTYVRPGDNVGRNDPCQCMSGKKFKKCCQEITVMAEREVRKISRIMVKNLG